MSKVKTLVYLVICFWVIAISSYSQNPQLTVEGNPYIGITSYNGTISGGTLGVVIVQQSGKLNMSNWKLSVKLITPIQALDGTIFPAEKISFIPYNTDGSGPTIIQIGMPTAAPLNGLSETFLVPNSNAPLSNNNQYFRHVLQFQLAAAGGAYLKDLFNKTGDWTKRYSTTFQFTLYDGNNNVIAAVNQAYSNMEIHRLSGNPPADEGQYSILVSTQASNAVLEFKTISDYINGKSVTYENGLSVSATTPYQLKVKSIDPSFLSTTPGQTLPLDIVRLQLRGSSLNVPISQTQQTILSGTSTGGSLIYFDITYSIEGNNPALFNVPPDQYQTSLIYEITPQ